MPAGPSPPSDPSDAALRGHADAARRLARHLVFDRDRADDVAQEAMRVSLVRPAADGRSSLPWIRGIVRNVARAFLRREGRRPEVEARAFAEREARRSVTALDDPAALVARAEEHRRAVDAVLRLAEPYRAALILRFLEDLEPSEIARRQGVPLETARTRIRRGLDLVRAELDAHHDGDRRAWMGLLGPISMLPAPVALPHAPSPAHVPASVPVPALAGALAVKKLAAVALVLLLAGGAWRLFFVPTEDGVGTSGAAGPEVSTLEVVAGDATLAGRGRLASATGALPPPVALDAPGVIDRDRDIHGVVVHEDGTPVAGADVSAVVRPWSGAVLIGSPAKDGERTLASTRTAVDGTFALRLERGSAATLRVASPGVAAFEEELVGAGERLRIVLRPGVRFIVIVKDAVGGPVANAAVRLRRLVGRTTEGYVRASCDLAGTTSANGRFVFEDLPVLGDGPWSLLDVDVPGVGPAYFDRVQIPERGEATQEVALRTVRTLRGLVTDAETKAPIPNAVVGLEWDQTPRVTTGGDGRYEMPVLLAPTAMTVFAEADGYAWLGSHGGRDEGTIDFALVRVATVRGRLVDGDGVSVSDATLTAHGTMGATLPTGRAECRSGPDGRFVLVGLSPASASELWIDARGFGRRGLALDAIGDARERDLGDVFLKGARRLEGRVVDQAGKPVAGVYVRIDGASVEQTRFWRGEGRTPGRLADGRVTDDLGRFRFVDVAPGDYQLVVEPRGQAAQERKVVVRDEDVAGLEFTLRSGHTLVVHVRGSKGEKLDFTAIEVRFSDGSSHRERTGCSEVSLATRDEDVRVAVVGIPFGQRAPEPLRVPKGTDEVTITLLPADDWAVTGTVFDPDGHPLRGAMLDAVSRDSGRHYRARTDERGRFSVHLRGDLAALTLSGEVSDLASDRLVQGAFDADPVEVTRATGDIEIRTRRLSAGQTLRVVVQDPNGTPLSGIPVNLQLANGGAFLEPGVVDADGSVEFKNLVGRAVEVWRGSGVYTMGETWVDPFLAVVPAGQTIVFRFLAGTVVRGVVVGADGARVPHTVVYANAERRDRQRYTQTKADGTFSIALDPDRHVPLTLSVTQGGESQPLFVGRAEFTALPTEPVTIRLAPPPPATK